MKYRCVVCGAVLKSERKDTPMLWCNNCKERVPVEVIEDESEGGGDI